ncbi:hypothetical protein HOY80DRAFT_1033709 [Tuber brumale]|nr:hypothetical protein HOY80DRAFT_1033709 [Tuber brumale]
MVEAEARSSEHAEPEYIVGVKPGRLMEEVEHDLSVVNGWKEKGDLRRGNGEVRHVNQKKLRGSLADKPTSSCKNRTNINTAAWEPEPWVKRVGSPGDG